MKTVAIRVAREADIPAIVGFWNPVIRETTVTFASEEKSEAGLRAMFDARRAAGREVFVADLGGLAVGIASYDQFRGGDGYRHAMEHTVILAREVRGGGIGRRLMHALEDHARQAGGHVMVGGISGENAAGIAFHAALGYVETGRMPQVGRKFGRWLDLVLMQKLL
ncbi:MAG: N-acetyltransferase [Rhodobacteraceae bacterium]|nr:N-acetyltransferase [Paracoccaceae bacterium]